MSPNKNAILSEKEQNSFLAILNTKYASHLVGRFFELKIAEENSYVFVTVLLRNSTNSFYYPIEGKIGAREQDLSPNAAALLLIDYIDCYLGEFFNEDGDLYLPIEWSPHTFEEKEFQIKGQIFNLEKEQLADEWLKKGSGVN